MASSVISSAAVATVNRTPAQANMVAPFNGLKSTSAFPVTRKANNDITSIASNGGRVQCMQVIPFKQLWYNVVSFILPTWN
jgi:ribulose-bisphosphate carboxylase small chain